MPLIIELDKQMSLAGKTGGDIMEATGHTAANVSRFRTGKIKAIRLKSLHAICELLKCEPGDIIKFVTEEELKELLFERARMGEKVYVVDLGD